MSITFQVDPVGRTNLNQYKEASCRSLMSDLFSSGSSRESFSARVEACSDTPCLPLTGSSLINSISFAYNNHVPLTLSPDHIWMTIVVGLTRHVHNNSEKLRKKFTNSEYSIHIEVEANDFVLGSDTNDWEGLLHKFESELSSHIGENSQLLTCDFSTTGRTEKMASQVLTMGLVSRYFSYGMTTLCGFPEITLAGTVEDWESVLSRVRSLREFGDISWWIDRLEPVCEKMVETSKGNIDLSFWRSLYMENGGSGGPHITGNVNVFYPFLISYKSTFFPNKFDSKSNTLILYPTLLSSVPVRWKYLGTERRMRFVAGMHGVSLGESIAPAVHWCVLDVTNLSSEQVAKIGL